MYLIDGPQIHETSRGFAANKTSWRRRKWNEQSLILVVTLSKDSQISPVHVSQLFHNLKQVCRLCTGYTSSEFILQLGILSVQDFVPELEFILPEATADMSEH